MTSMYEFDSVSVSSFEAAALAATLTERSADGWEVVAVVPAGSDVVAYLRRGTTDAGGVDRGEPVLDEAVSTTGTESAAEEAAADVAATELLSSDAGSSGDTEPATVSAAAESEVPADTGGDAATIADSDASPDAGGTGWGAGADTAETPVVSTLAADEDDTSGATEVPMDAASTSASTESTTWDGSARQSEAPATPSVPAGWYADPAGRFELRYWDGCAWTEHVSRAGQQYTDPPVA